MMRKKKIYRKMALSLFLVLMLAIILFVVMLLLNVTDYGITIASFGATVFMVLSRKKLSKRKIFGAYLVASSFGFLISRLPTPTLLNVAIVTLSSITAMTLLELQHAPAIGIAISMVLNRFSFWTDLVVVFSLMAIIGLAMVLKSCIEDPEKLLNFVRIETEKINWNL